MGKFVILVMLSLISNLKFFLLSMVLLFILGSCNKEKLDVIPDVVVDFYIDLNDPVFFDLNAIGNHVLVDKTTNNLGYVAAGFDDNGIIVYRSQLDEFLAYDRTCPYDYAIKGLSIAVDVDGIYAECPECGSLFALPSFGSPSSGPSNYPLKVYKTSFSGQFVHVYNN